MDVKWRNRITVRAGKERALLAAGQSPPTRLKNPIQRSALRALAVFFSLMLVFTLFSRAADGVTIARVQADTAKSGVLTDRVTADGRIDPEGDYGLSLPEGLKIESVQAKQGQKVEQGEALLTLDYDGLDGKRSALGKEIQLLALKIDAAEKGISGSGSVGILSAQQALADAQADYERLEDKLKRGELRQAEDFVELGRQRFQAEMDYEKAVKKTKEALVKAAEDALKQAQEALETAQDAAEDAIASAQQAYEQAQDNDQAASLSYQSAENAYSRAKKNLTAAKQNLSDLEAQDPQDPAAIADAKAAVASAQATLDQAEGALDAQGGRSNSAATARDNLKRTKERWEKNTSKAKEALGSAEAELAAANSKTDLREEAPVIAAQSSLDAAEKALLAAKRDQEDGVFSQEEQLHTARRAIESAKHSLDAAQRQAAEESRSDAQSRAQAEIERLSYQQEKQKLEEQLQALEGAAAHEGLVLAPIGGTVLTIPEKGTKTQADADVVTLSRSDLGFTFEAELDRKLAQKLSTGDKGTLAYTHEGKTTQVEVRLRSIGAANEEGKVVITASLPSGSYPTGASGQLTVTRRSEKHNSCLPLSALRSGSNGDHVLVLRESKTILGTEWTVVEVPITVKDRDSELMSIESTLMWEDQVVTGADKPIGEGDRVRLENT